MKRDEIRLPRHFWRWRVALFFLTIHIIVYAFVWVQAFARVLQMQWLEGASLSFITGLQSQIGAAVIWLPIFLLHVGIHLYFAGRSGAGNDEREAYREGFRDGARYAAADDVYDARPRRHLEIGGDGELVEFPLEGKQKRRGG